MCQQVAKYGTVAICEHGTVIQADKFHIADIFLRNGKYYLSLTDEFKDRGMEAFVLLEMSMALCRYEAFKTSQN